MEAEAKDLIHDLPASSELSALAEELSKGVTELFPVEAIEPEEAARIAGELAAAGGFGLPTGRAASYYRSIITEPRTVARAACGSCGSSAVTVAPLRGKTGVTLIVCGDCGTGFTIPVMAVPEAYAEPVEAAGEPEPCTAAPSPSEPAMSPEGASAAPGEEAFRTEFEVGALETEAEPVESADGMGSDPDSFGVDSATGVAETALDRIRFRDREERGDYSAAKLDTMRASAFYRRVRDIMADNRYDRRVSGQRSGKLDNRSLYKVRLGSDRVFSKPTERKGKEYNVVLIVDESGSMDGYIPTSEKGRETWTRRRLAAEVARVMAEGLGRAGVAFAVVGYNEHIRLHKDWEQRIAPETIAAEIDSARLGSASNYDYLAIRKAEELLARRSSGENVVMLICDGGLYNTGHVYNDPRLGGKAVDACTGYPLSGSSIFSPRRTVPDDKAAFARHCGAYTVSHEIAKHAAFITIGIETEEPKHWFPNPHTVHTVEEFMTTVTRELGKVIRRF